jgi:hypothetical protein
MATLDTEVDYDGENLMPLREAIKKIPGEEGWWKSYSEEEYIKLATELLDNGFSAERTYHFLCEAYMAVAECYGG